MQTDRQTDGQTPADSKDRERLAVKTDSHCIFMLKTKSVISNNTDIKDVHTVHTGSFVYSPRSTDFR